PFDLSEFVYAHRGLWRSGGPSENSLDAFMAASDAGLGIEFDVRPSADGVPIIFHDMDLQRMASSEDLVEAHPASNLVGRALQGGGLIPALTDLLDVWPADLPLLCELKVDGATDPAAFAHRVGGLLLRHQGLCAAMSFSTRAVKALPDGVMRGQLVTPHQISETAFGAALSNTDVAYFACHVSDAGRGELQTLRARHPIVAWTVTDPEQCAALSELTDSQIFEGFNPTLAKRHILNR
ncbi:MAG: glycerophosphodiester phosphodiesterase family protein, partial [Pseudomonadota bacterium]